MSMHTRNSISHHLKATKIKGGNMLRVADKKNQKCLCCGQKFKAEWDIEAIIDVRSYRTSENEKMYNIGVSTKDGSLDGQIGPNLEPILKDFVNKLLHWEAANKI